MKEVVEKLIEQEKTISTMESCTGGCVVNEITNISGASSILKFSAVTYSNEFKIKMGVDKRVIDEYSVYSMETAKEMSKKISDYTSSDYGVGITGKINASDPNNLMGKDNIIFISIYDKNTNEYTTKIVEALNKTRKENKEMITKVIGKMLISML